MKSSKINWLYNTFSPGFLILLAFIWIGLSFIFFQVSKISQLLIVAILLAYFVGLIIKKYSNQKRIFLVSVLIFTSVCLFYRMPKSQPDLNKSLIILPDQVKIKDDYLFGTGEIDSQKVSIGFKPDKNIEKMINKSQPARLINLKAELDPIAGPTNPGEPNYKKFYESKNIYWRLKIQSYQVISKKKTIIDKMHIFRAKVQKYFQTFPKLVSFMASEMILAENPNDDNKTILNNYKNLGVIHLLSISGLHVGLYTIFISLACSYLKRTELETSIICTVFLAIEIFLSSFQAGFVRASISYVLGRYFKFKRIPVSQTDQLGLVAILHLCINPKLFLNSGAILSYLLVFGLQLTRNYSKLKQGLALNLLITPILLFTFYQVNTLTVFYNFLIVPIFNFVLLPLTFLAIITSKFFPQLLNIIEKIFEVITNFINLLANKKFGMITFGQLTWWQTLGILLLTACSLILIKNKIAKLSLKSWLVISYLLVFMSIHFPLQGQVSFIDVGQGDSILITTPINRHVYLIDTGGKVSFGKKKVQPQINKITIPFLYSQGIDKIDGVFLSHQDADHIGDLGPLLEQIKVKKLYFAKGLTDNPSFQRRVAGKIKYTKLQPLLAGDVVREKGITFNTVFPFEPGLGKNEDSLSLYFKLANKSWLFTGDLDREGEKKIIARTPLQVDYFKLGHHGSKTSSDPDFLKNINPKIVFISSGRHNRFGHPHQETMDTLRQLNIPALNTQDSGTITWNYTFFGKQKFSTFLEKDKK